MLGLILKAPFTSFVHAEVSSQAIQSLKLAQFLLTQVQ